MKQCEQCGGIEGEIKDYNVTTPHGTRVRRTVHPGECLTRYIARYTKWFNEQIDNERYQTKRSA